VATRIRAILRSNQKASHFRIATNAFEFNLFAKNSKELDEDRRLLEANGFQVLSQKLLDTPPIQTSKEQAIGEAIELFNEERFWESHEVLEQVWRSAKGRERDVLQGVILTAAAFVHYQKGELDICISVLRRAREKIGNETQTALLDIEGLKLSIDTILRSGQIRLFKLGNSRF
jgi:Domain of unknown function (DUF309)